MPRIILLFLINLAACHIAVSSSEDIDLTNSLPAKVIAMQVQHIHLSDKLFNDNLATNAMERLIDSLDPGHVYFLASDIAGFEEQASKLDDQMLTGDISFSSKVVDKFLARVSNRVDYVDLCLDKGFDLTIDETYEWDRKDAPWPANEKEWDELWRRKIKNEYVAKLVSDELTREDATTEKVTEKDEEEEADEDDSDALLSPEDFVKKKYHQFLIVLRDNDLSWLQQTYLTAFMQAFDPHSQYLSPTTLKNFEISMKLSLVGIGALLKSEDGAAKVVKLIPGGAAEKDGRLKPGDKIIAVAQGDKPAVNILHMPLNKAVMLIRGKKGTTVVLHVIPVSDPTGARTTKIDLVRDIVKLEDQKVKGETRKIKCTDGKTRSFEVISVPTFYADMNASDEKKGGVVSCSKDVEHMLCELDTNEVCGVLLDLRNNGGGSLREAIEMTGLFIQTGPVVQLKDRNSVSVYQDNDPSIAYEGPLAVLINRQSASASEIVAAALQDYGRAVIIGDSKTHGKGTVQTVIDLNKEYPGFGALKLTTAGFYRIAGGSTQIEGVSADVVIPSVFDTMDIGEEYLPNALPYDTVPPTIYDKLFTNTTSFLPVLITASTARRNSDERFESYRKLKKLLAKRMKTEEVSLNYKTRLQQAQDQKNLDEFREAQSGQDEDTDDLIKDEALHVLADMMLVRSGKKLPKPPVARSGHGIATNTVATAIPERNTSSVTDHDQTVTDETKQKED